MPRIYVGTYGKYNSGSIAGAWLDLENYSTKEEFLEACAALHKDEADPELMFQDFEGFPREFYSESSVPEALWDWLGMDEEDRQLLAAYVEHVDRDGTLEQARDALMGTCEGSAADFAAQWLEELGTLEAIPENLRNYFDFEAYARDMRYDGVTFARDTEGTLWVFGQ